MATLKSVWFNATNKRKWLAALRSGKYKQGCGSLRDGISNPSFCCLGVYADVVGAKWDNAAFPMIGKTAIGDDTFLKSKVTGLSRRIQGILSEMNDVYGKDFRTIARYIEDHVKPIRRKPVTKKAVKKSARRKK